MSEHKKKFLELTRMKYYDQAKWFLNGFWKDGAEENAEQIWIYTHKFIDLDDKKKDGCELDEFRAHKFLENFGETLTIIQLREKLRQIDLDMNGKMALLEYLAFRYGKTVKQVIDAPQGGNQEEIEAAQIKLQEVQNQLEKQQKALEQQKNTEELVKKSEAELRIAVEELKKQEESFQNQLQTLENKSKDPNVSMVNRNKASVELAQLKQENPLPLRKAKITQEAALRKVEKERKAAEVATAEAEEQTRKVEKVFKEAQEYLEEVKKKRRCSIWCYLVDGKRIKRSSKIFTKKKTKIIKNSSL
jgi:chromosome segregation ATPase